jgi:hypothetical protein
MELFTKELEVAKGAIFSTDKKYRYALWRVWNDAIPPIMFIGLNPSKADSVDDDATIRRVKRFAKDWGYGGVYMLNLFAIISTDPGVLLHTKLDPVGLDTDYHLHDKARICSDVCFAWGNFTQAKYRSKEVIEQFPNALCLMKNKNGTPMHPLMCRADVEPYLFTSKTIEK